MPAATAADGAAGCAATAADVRRAASRLARADANAAAASLASRLRSAAGKHANLLLSNYIRQIGVLQCNRLFLYIEMDPAMDFKYKENAEVGRRTPKVLFFV